MSKIIVTHMNPDLDAMTSVWLLKRFGGTEWEEAEAKFIPAGQTYKGEKVDSNPEVVHVDVGLGKFDHHHSSDEALCAAKLVFDWLVTQSKQFRQNQALVRLVEMVRQFDWAHHLGAKDADSDLYSFVFFEHGIIAGWQAKWRNKSDLHFTFGLTALDGVYENLKAKVEAEAVVKKALKFKTVWGRGLAASTATFGFPNFAQAKGYPIVVCKNPKSGHVRIHAFEFGKNRRKINLTGVWEILKHKDPQATWFLHAGKKMLLNGSRANPDMIPTKLTLREVVEVLKKVD